MLAEEVGMRREPCQHECVDTLVKSACRPAKAETGPVEAMHASNLLCMRHTCKCVFIEAAGIITQDNVDAGRWIICVSFSMALVLVLLLLLLMLRVHFRAGIGACAFLTLLDILLRL